MAKKRQQYRVTWKIDIIALSAVKAAKQALKIQRDKNCRATVFDVTSEDGDTVCIDLEEEGT